MGIIDTLFHCSFTLVGDNVAYGILQNGRESLNLEQNISYGAYTDGQDDDYVLVSNGYGTTVRKVPLSYPNQD